MSLVLTFVWLSALLWLLLRVSRYEQPDPREGFRPSERVRIERARRGRL